MGIANYLEIKNMFSVDNGVKKSKYLFEYQVHILWS